MYLLAAATAPGADSDGSAEAERIGAKLATNLEAFHKRTETGMRRLTN